MVRSLNEYIETVESKIKNWGFDFGNTAHPWYRGHSDERWTLEPSLYRGNFTGYYEREMSRDFQLNAIPFLEHHPKTYIEWMYIMQHYGLPTRLLDWTESYLNALFFALEDFSDSHHNPCVWIFAPWSLNINTINQKTIPTHVHDKIKGYELRSPSGDIVRQVDATFDS